MVKLDEDGFPEPSDIHKGILSLKLLDRRDRKAFFSRARLFKAIKGLKPHKIKYNECTTMAQFWVSLGYKPSSVENSIRIYSRFGKLIEKTIDELDDIAAIPSRLQKVLSIKAGTEDQEKELLHLCTDLMPYKDFLETINKAKGKPEQSCNHSGEKEQWTKCVDCGQWEQVKTLGS